MRFYKLNDALDERYYDGSPVPYPHDLGAFVLGPEPPCPLPVRYEMESGTEQGDFMFPSLCSDRLIEVLESCQATGYRTYPVEVYMHGRRIPGYQGLLVVGRGGPLDMERSGAKRESWGLSHKAVYMDESRWDGSDVFSIEEKGISIFVTERVAEALQRAQLRNVKLVPNSECSLYFTTPVKDEPVPEYLEKTQVGPLPPAEVRSFIASLTEELFARVSLTEIGRRACGQLPELDRAREVVRRAPPLLDLLEKALARQPRDCAEVMAVLYELMRLSEGYLEGSMFWGVLAVMGLTMGSELQRRGLSEEEIEEAVQAARRRCGLDVLGEPGA